jgi:hypothetical protein
MFGMFAGAQCHTAAFRHIEFLGIETCPGMRTVTKRLPFRATAGAEIVVTGLHFENAWFLISDHRFVHLGSFIANSGKSGFP